MNWKDYPIVKLKNLVEKEEWYKLSKGKFWINSDEIHYNLNPTANTPTQCNVKLDYNIEYNCQIDMWTELDKLVLKCRYPYMRGIRRKKVSTPEKAMKKLLEIYEEIIAHFDASIETDKRREELHNAKLERRAQIIENLGMQVSKGYSEHYPLLFEIRLSKAHRVMFSCSEHNTNKFEVKSIKGELTLDQVRELVKLISSFPQIMADRLIHGKGE